MATIKLHNEKLAATAQDGRKTGLEKGFISKGVNVEQKLNYEPIRHIDK